MGKKKSKAPLIIICILLILIIALAAATVTLSKLKVELMGESEMSLASGEEFSDPGAYAELHLPFNLITLTLASCDMTIDGTVDTATPGDYPITYEASFFVWSGKATRTVHVADTTPPEITLTGSTEITLYYGQSYTEEGYTATDNVDGDITDKVERVESDDAITYTVADSAGNTATAARTITRLQAEPTDHVVYLTFDDGPGAYTEQLLEVLAKHNVKATFFVTANGDTSLIAKEAAAGHSIGVHSASHNYQQIYASEEAYLADFERMESIIEEQTGSRTNLFRFPGGSSNTVSSFNPGIMTKLTQDMTAKGYYYFDWNVSSGDAGGTTSADQVYQNVITGIQQHSASVVLQHDIKSYSVEAVDRILTWGEQNGYTFLPLSAASPGAHHGVNN